jgi:hypothetical protein
MGDVLLRTLELAGMYVAFAAPIIVLALVRPGLRALGDDPDGLAAARGFADSAARWGMGAAALAGLAVLLQLPNRVADIEDTTVLAGVDAALVARFALTTVTGRLALVEASGLLAAAVALARTRRDPVRAAGAWWTAAVLAGVTVSARSLAGHAAAQPTARGLATRRSSRTSWPARPGWACSASSSPLVSSSGTRPRRAPDSWWRRWSRASRRSRRSRRECWPCPDSLPRGAISGRPPRF